MDKLQNTNMNIKNIILNVKTQHKIEYQTWYSYYIRSVEFFRLQPEFLG